MFRTYIPNGLNVKNPFHTATNGQPEIWRGMGHMALEGGGPRNPFGKAFKANGFVSTGVDFHYIKNVYLDANQEHGDRE